MAKDKLGDVKLDSTGQDWRVYLTNKPPKRETEVTTGLWRIESGKQYATPVETEFNEYGVIIVRFAARAPFLPDAPAEIDPDCGDTWLKFVADWWPKCQPVAYEDMEKAKETGEWPDGQLTSARGAMGGNNPPEEAADAMLRQARENLEKAKKLVEAGAAKTQTAADTAANLEKAMSTQRASLEGFHEAEKKPFLEAGRKVDERFLPLVKEMKKIGAEIHTKVKTPFLREQERLRAEAAAAAQKVIDDAAAAAAAEAQANAPATPLDAGWEEASPAFQPAIEVRATRVTAGGRGARSGLSDKKYGKIVDMKLMVLRMVENIGLVPELKTLLENYATRIARTAAGENKTHGQEIYPGVQMDIRRE